MNLEKILKNLEALSDDATVKTFDITTKEGYKGFKNTINELRGTDSTLFDMLGLDMDEWLDNVSDLAETIYENSNKENNEEEPKEIERKVIDHTEGEEFKRPSELLTVDQKLKLHKLVQEYVDTTIRPFNKGVLSNDQINDVYAGLYEFGAWILNK